MPSITCLGLYAAFARRVASPATNCAAEARARWAAGNANREKEAVNGLAAFNVAGAGAGDADRTV